MGEAVYLLTDDRDFLDRDFFEMSPFNDTPILTPAGRP